METHGVKHHYHLHQASQPANHLANHNSLSSSQPFSFGSSPSQGQNTGSKLNFETSTAFPLLLSSIESGRQNFNAKPVPFSRPKSTSSSSSSQPPHNAAGNVNNHSAHQASSQSGSTLAQFSQTGAGKHRHEPSSHHLTNGGVKATPKSKSAATPNLITSSGRQQATFGHSTNGHSQTKSSSHLTAETGATLASSALPFKKNLLARETSLNNNGTCSRSRASPNKENKTAPLSSAPATPAAGAPQATTVRRPSIRSPTRASGPAAKQATVNASGSVNHHQQHLNSSHNHIIVNGNGGAGGGPFAFEPLDRCSTTVNSSPQSNGGVSLPKPKPKEFKFFKEKAKDKLHKSFAIASVQHSENSLSETVSKAVSKSTTSLTPSLTKVKTTSSSSNGTVKKASKVSITKANKSSAPPGKTKTNNSSSNSNAIGKQTPSHQLSSAVVKSLSPPLSDVACTPLSRNDDHIKVPPAEEASIERVIYFTKRLVDGFTFQCFKSEDLLECSLQDAVSRNIAVLNFKDTSPSTDIAAQQPTPTPSSTQPTSLTTTPTSQLQQQLSPQTQPPTTVTPPVRFIFRHRSPSPSSSSDAESDSSTIQSSLSPRAHNGTRSPLRPSKSANKSKVSKEKRAAKPPKKKSMAKESKAKKTKSKEKKELTSDSSDDSEDADLDEEAENEEDDGEEEVSLKPSRKSNNVKAVKCTHKHQRSRTACNRCLPTTKTKKNKNKEVEKKGQTTRVGNNNNNNNSSSKGKTKTAQAPSSKTKCKPSKAPKKPAPTASTSKALKGKQSQKKPVSEDEESSSEEEQSEEDDDQSASSSEEESDATQEEESDHSDRSEECEETKRTIADLIKCSTRREAVRKAAERAALASVNARSKANRTAPVTPATEATAVASTSNPSLGPPAPSDTADIELSSGKNSKLKKMPNKTKSSGATTKQGKRSSSNKRSQSDFSSNEDEESSQSEEEEAEPITSPRRGRTLTKASKATKNTKRSKLDATEEPDAEDEESDSEEDEPVAAKKGKALKRPGKGKTTNSEQPKKKGKELKQSSKNGKLKPKQTVESDCEHDEDSHLTEDQEETRGDQNATDAELEGETHTDNSKKSKAAAKVALPNQGKCKEKKASGKAARTAAAKPASSKSNTSKAKTTKGDKGNSKKGEKAASKKSVANQSDDDTEQSELEDATGAERDVESAAAHPKTANLKSKCDKPKAKAATEAASTSAASTGGASCPVKDVYTFELSPAEVPSANTRFVLSSGHGHESKVRLENSKTETNSEQASAQLTVDVPVTCSTAAATAGSASPVPVKSSFSPQIVSGGPLHREGGPSFEPLRPDAYSHYEPPFGPNASLSSLSQLSQSIGGGAGPILLNHQPTPGNKCQINIKEEPRDEGSQSSFRVAHPKPSFHRTPPPAVMGEHLTPSQNYGANFASSVNNKVTHPRRLWSNASAGSLISSSSSSSSSPVHLAFGQCPPGPPTPATPASLASYFTPSNSLPALPSSFYPPTSQELIRRELDSRILASTVSDRNLLPSSLGIPPPAGSLTPIPPHTPFNHAPTSPMIPTSNSSLNTSSASLMASANSLSYPITSHINHQTAFSPTVATRQTPTLHGQQALESAASPAKSRPQSPKVKPLLANVPKGTWSSMHIKIAKDIYQRQKEMYGPQKSMPNLMTSSSSSSSSKTTTPSRSNSKSSASSSHSRAHEPLVTVSQQPVVASSSSATSSRAPTSSSKNSHETTISTMANSMRPASVGFSANYPPRYGTPFGPPSMSAPPILPGLFPPSIPSPMSLSGFLPDGWPRPPLPGTMPAPNSTVANRAPAPFMFPDYYANINSASSALSAWAAGIRPPGDSFPPLNKQPIESNKSAAAASSSSSGSQKRKHDDLESHGKERAHSSRHHAPSSATTSYQNGDLRSEHSNNNKKSHSSTSSSKHHKSDHSGSSSSSSSRSALENGERTRPSESHSDFSGSNSSNSKSSKSSHETRHDSRPNFGLSSTAVSSAHSSSPFASSPFFSGSHTPFPSPSEHQRYMELLGMNSAMNSALPSHSNSFIAAAARNSMDLASRPLWPFGLPPPPNPSASPVLGSSMMPDPFKSLTDISLRPGLVTPDRETLFSRYSMLNSSGGGASIFDKMSKEQLDKFEILQGKPNQPNVSSSSRPSHSSSERPPSVPSASRSTPTHRVSLPPPTSTALPPSSTPFSYPNPYLNSLHHLGAPSSFLSQPPMGHPSFAPGNPMLNGVDSLSKLALSHPGSMPSLSSGLASDSQFMLPPHFPPPPGPGASMMNFLKGGNPAPSSTNYSSTR